MLATTPARRMQAQKKRIARPTATGAQQVAGDVLDGEAERLLDAHALVPRDAAGDDPADGAAEDRQHQEPPDESDDELDRAQAVPLALVQLVPGAVLGLAVESLHHAVDLGPDDGHGTKRHLQLAKGLLHHARDRVDLRRLAIPLSRLALLLVGRVGTGLLVVRHGLADGHALVDRVENQAPRPQHDQAEEGQEDRLQVEGDPERLEQGPTPVGIRHARFLLRCSE
jgi:hypothetical protein